MYDNVLAILAGLAGLGGLISVLVNLLKIIGVVKDGTSETWFQGLEILAFIAVAVVYFIETPIDWGEVDGWLKFAASFVGLIVQVISGKITYKTIKGAPVVGFSYSK
jgi:hypothetical protein